MIDILAAFSGFGDYFLLTFIFLCLANAIAITFHQLRHKSGGIATKAEVISLQKHTDSEGEISYTPTFRITDGPHTGAEWASHSSSAPPAHKIGEVVAATYDPTNGVIHSKATARGNWIIVVAMLSFAALLLWVLVRP